MNKFFCKSCQKWHYGKSLEGMCLKCYSLKLRTVEVLPIKEFRSRMLKGNWSDHMYQEAHVLRHEMPESNF